MKAIYDLMKSNNIKTITEKYTHNINELDKHLNANFFSKFLRKMYDNEQVFHIRRDYFFDNKENYFEFVDYYQKTNGETYTCKLKLFLDEQSNIYKIEKYNNNEYIESIYTKFTYDDNGNLKELCCHLIASPSLYKNSIYYGPPIIVAKYNSKGKVYDSLHIYLDGSAIREIFNFDNNVVEISRYEEYINNFQINHKLNYFDFIPTIPNNKNLIRKKHYSYEDFDDGIFDDDTFYDDNPFLYIDINYSMLYVDAFTENPFNSMEKNLIFDEESFYNYCHELSKKYYNGNTISYHSISFDDLPNEYSTIPNYIISTKSSDGKYFYENDSRGNWIKKTGFINNKQVVIAERTIEYYD